MVEYKIQNTLQDIARAAHRKTTFILHLHFKTSYEKSAIEKLKVISLLISFKKSKVKSFKKPNTESRHSSSFVE